MAASRSLRLAIPALVSLLAAAGCSSSDSSRPPSASDCTTADCAGGSGNGGGGGRDSGTPDVGADVDLEAGDDAPGDGGLTVTGFVRVTNPGETKFHDATKFDQPANVKALVPGGARDVVSTSGTGQFALSGLPVGPLWWAVSDRVGGTSLVSTLLSVPVVDGPSPSVALVALDAPTFKQVYETNPASNGTPFGGKPNTGHVLVFFVDGLGAPVAGVRVSNTANAGVVLYDQGATYGTAPPKTQNDGIAILYDIPATAFPGSEVTLGFDVGADAGVDGGMLSRPVPVAAGWVTKIEVQAAP